MGNEESIQVYEGTPEPFPTASPRADRQMSEVDSAFGGDESLSQPPVLQRNTRRPKALGPRNVLVISTFHYLLERLVRILRKEKDLRLIVPANEYTQQKLGHSRNVTYIRQCAFIPCELERHIKNNKVDTIVFYSAGNSELLNGRNMATVAKRCDTVNRVVYVSSCDHTASGSSLATEMITSREIAQGHVERAVFELSRYGIESTVFGPAIFFEEDEDVMVEVCCEGWYPRLVGRWGASRVAAADVAFAVRNCLVGPNRGVGMKINLGSEEWFTDADLEQIWSAAVGDPIDFNENSDNPEWTKYGVIDSSSGGHNNGRDLLVFYEKVRANGYGVSRAQAELQSNFIGQALRPYDKYVERLVKNWKRQEQKDLVETERQERRYEEIEKDIEYRQHQLELIDVQTKERQKQRSEQLQRDDEERKRTEFGKLELEKRVMEELEQRQKDFEQKQKEFEERQRAFELRQREFEVRCSMKRELPVEQTGQMQRGGRRKRSRAR